MNPILSWAIFFVIVLGYFAVNGVPRSLPRPFIQESDRSDGLSKRNKKQARSTPTRRDSKTSFNSGQVSGSEVQQSQMTKSTLSKLAKDKKSSRVNASNVKTQATHSANKNSLSDGQTAISNHQSRSESSHDSDDPVENVMNGRPRKTSTPIGMRSSKLAATNGSAKSPVVAHTSEDEDEFPQSYVQSRQVSQSHATDDMLPANNSSLPRTLKIVPSTKTNSLTTSTQKPKKAEDKMTKKQRQNAAKKLKAKAEKAEADERQAAALRSHKKIREAQRLAEQDNHSNNAFSSGSNNAWDPQDWKTVSKNKKVTSAEALPPAPADTLIWDP